MRAQTTMCVAGVLALVSIVPAPDHDQDHTPRTEIHMKRTTTTTTIKPTVVTTKKVVRHTGPRPRTGCATAFGTPRRRARRSFGPPYGEDRTRVCGRPYSD